VTPGNHWTNWEVEAPSSKFSNSAARGTRVPRKTQAPLTRSGSRSAAEQDVQSITDQSYHRLTIVCFAAAARPHPNRSEVVQKLRKRMICLQVVEEVLYRKPRADEDGCASLHVRIAMENGPWGSFLDSSVYDLLPVLLAEAFKKGRSRSGRLFSR